MGRGLLWMLVAVWMAACSSDDGGMDEVMLLDADADADAQAAGDAGAPASPSDEEVAGGGSVDDGASGEDDGLKVSGDGDGDGGDVSAPAAEPVACPEAALEPGDHRFMIDHGGVTFSYLLHVPEGSREARPLVLNYHGFTSNADQQWLLTDMSAAADERDVLVAYPQSPTASWAAGKCCLAEPRDDVGLARAIVADVAGRVCVDRSRVYATGMSNGGFMSHRLGCEAADLFAAVAPVAGVLGVDGCEPSRPMPVLHFHGTADLLVPYEGGGAGEAIGFGPFMSVRDSFDTWSQLDGCTDEPLVSYKQGAAVCETRSECEGGAEVTLCTIEGFGHCWPSSAICPDPLDVNQAIDATAAILDFFARFAL